MKPTKLDVLLTLSALLPLWHYGAVVVDSLEAAAGPTEDSLKLSWHVRSGHTYFVLTSEDLVNWTSLPLIEAGANEVVEYTIQLPPGFGKRFWRLAITDQVAADPAAADLTAMESAMPMN
ncbi:MAG: hypothetical protein Q8M02_14000 [Candidatus Didemnitutus sp.]|nr:hypothetical protein [Candidatus Didemnitutus sp.]